MGLFDNFKPSYQDAQMAGIRAYNPQPAPNPLSYMQSQLPQGVWSQPGQTPILDWMGVKNASASDGGGSVLGEKQQTFGDIQPSPGVTQQVINTNQNQNQNQNTGGSNGEIASWLRGHGYNNQSVIDQLTKDNPEWLRNAMNPPASTGPSAEDLARQEEARIQGEIDKIYNPSIQGYADTEAELKRQFGAQAGNLKTGYETDTAQQTEEGKLLKANLANQRRLTEQGALSANEQARRAFRALQQQAQARFGGRGSAGMAATEIATKEFARQQGGLNQALVNALENFGLKDTEVGVFITQRKNDLDKWKREATEQLQANLNSGILSINQAKNATETAKGEAKLQLLREASNTARQIQENDKTLRATLAANAIQSAERISQRAMSIPDRVAMYNAMFSAQLTGIGGIGQAASAAGPQLIGMGRRPEDEIG